MSGFLRTPGAISGPISGSGADGYVAFFTGATGTKIGGDNDLYWDRATNQLLVGNGSSTTPSLSWQGDADSGLYWASANQWRAISGGNVMMGFGPATVSLSAYPFNSNGQKIYDSTGPLYLGTTFTTGHGLATGDIGTGGKLEVDGETFLDSNASVGQNLTVGGNIVNNNLTQAFSTIRKGLDGYTTATGSYGDGYICFFTGSNKIAGDNDLYWNRATNQLLLRPVDDYTAPQIATVGDPDTGIALDPSGLSNVLYLVAGGTATIQVFSNGIIVGAYINMGSNRVYNSAGPLYLGTVGTTGHSLATGDCLMGGKLEVDGSAYFDGALITGGSTTFADNNSLYVGGSGSTYNAVDLATIRTQLAINLGSGYNRHLVFGDRNNHGQNYDHALQTNPTLFIHSAMAPDTDNTQWLSFAHDQTNAQIDTGSGGLVLDPANGMVKVDGYADIDGYLFVSSSISLGYQAVSADYYLDGSKSVIGVDTAAARTIFLPDASDFRAGTMFIIKDATGNASAQNITIKVAEGTDLIDGATSVTISANYNSLTFIGDGVSKWLIV